MLFIKHRVVKMWDINQEYTDKGQILSATWSMESMETDLNTHNSFLGYKA